MKSPDYEILPFFCHCFHIFHPNVKQNKKWWEELPDCFMGLLSWRFLHFLWISLLFLYLHFNTLILFFGFGLKCVCVCSSRIRDHIFMFLEKSSVNILINICFVSQKESRSGLDRVNVPYENLNQVYIKILMFYRWKMSYIWLFWNDMQFLMRCIVWMF